VGRAPELPPAVLVLDRVPQSLSSIDLDAHLVSSVELTLLPPDELSWPQWTAIVWPAPRGADLRPEQAQALRRWVLDGGHLVAGVDPEQPRALEEAGLGELFLARPTRGAGLDVSLVSRVPADAGGWQRARCGWGTTTITADDLARTAAPRWRELLALESDDDGSARRRLGAEWSMRLGVVQFAIAEGLVPEPPLALAGAVLGAFFLFAVPLDIALARRALRAGRRSRWGSLRMPAGVAAATVACFLVADGAAGGGLASRRIDFVDFDPETGSAVGRTLLVMASGRAGRATLSVGEDAHLLDVESRDSRSWMRTGVTDLIARAGSAGSAAAEIDFTSWKPVHVTTAWRAEGVDRPDLTADALPGDLLDRGVVARRCAEGGACEPAVGRLPGATHAGERELTLNTWTIGPDDLLNAPLHRADTLERPVALRSSRPALQLVVEGAAGPPVFVDGREVVGPALTVFTRRLPEPHP
jgi:hypothetical protein